MLLGCLMIVSSLCLALFNICQSQSAGKASDEIMSELEQEIIGGTDGLQSGDDMPVTFIDGYDYIGYLTISALDLQLPVMSSWDYTRLTYAPCRYYGSAKTNDLVIAAHNFSTHFGRISSLEAGDEVVFTDMNGAVYSYTVADMEVLPPDAVLDMIDSGWDLTLYTCNYAGTERVTVRCMSSASTRNS